MRRSYSPVTFFYPNGIADTIMQTESAPRASYATFHCSQCFTICMTAFKTGFDQLRPYFREVIEMSSKHINTLSPCNLRIEIIFFCDLPDGDQFFGSDLTSGDTGCLLYTSDAADERSSVD